MHIEDEDITDSVITLPQWKKKRTLTEITG